MDFKKIFKMGKKGFIGSVVDNLVVLFIGIGVLTIVVVLLAMILSQSQSTIATVTGSTTSMAYNLTTAGLNNVNTANSYVGLFITVAIFVLLLSMVMLLRVATNGRRM
jgi:hypothetical protein